MKTSAFVLASVILGSSTWAQVPPPGFSRTEAQQRYVARRQALPTPFMRVHGSAKALGASQETRTAVLFGSLGTSAGWSVGAVMYIPQVVLRNVDSKQYFAVIPGQPDGFMVHKGIGDDLQGAGEKAGLMSYGAFRIALEPGEYEISQFASIRGGIDDTFASRREKYQPVRFQVEAGKPAYLGRMVLVPRLVELPVLPVRPGWEHAGSQGGPTHKIDGFQVWLQDALAADKRLARVQEEDVRSLTDSLVEQGQGFFRREVRYDELDHNGINAH